MNNKVLCSTGGLFKKNNDYVRIIEDLCKIDCDGLEFMMLNSWDNNLKDIISSLTSTGMCIPAFHTQKKIGEIISRNENDDNKKAQELFEMNCDVAKSMGAQILIQHLWGGIPSDKNIENNIEQYSIMKEIAKRYGLILTIENVCCNTKDPLTHMATLKDRYDDIYFTYDTKFAAFHNQLELLDDESWRWLWEESCVKHIHINDYSGGYMDWSNLSRTNLQVGTGNIDFKSFFSYITKVNYTSTITLEAILTDENGNLDIDGVNESLKYIKSFI